MRFVIKKGIAFFCILALHSIKIASANIDTLELLTNNGSKYWERSESFNSGDCCVFGLNLTRDNSFISCYSYIYDGERTAGGYKSNDSGLFAIKSPYGLCLILRKDTLFLYDKHQHLQGKDFLSPMFKIEKLSKDELIMSEIRNNEPKQRLLFRRSKDQSTEIADISGDILGRLLTDKNELTVILEETMKSCNLSNIVFPDGFRLRLSGRINKSGYLSNISIIKKNPHQEKYSKFYKMLLKNLLQVRGRTASSRESGKPCSTFFFQILLEYHYSEIKVILNTFPLWINNFSEDDYGEV